jgi:hypothetical protein
VNQIVSVAELMQSLEDEYAAVVAGRHLPVGVTPV